MPVNQGDLVKPEPGEVINLSTPDLYVKPVGLIRENVEKVEKFGKGVKDWGKDVGQKAAVKAVELSRRDLFKLIWWYGTRVGLPVMIAVFSFIERQGIVDLVKDFGDKFEVVENKPVDPRVTKKFGEEYQAEARIQALGQYSLYVLGNSDPNFDITNIPEPGDKDNVNWYLTNQYEITWPFVTQERDKGVVDADLFTIADKEVFIGMISADLGLNEQQQQDLWVRYDELSRDSEAVLKWLLDLQKQGNAKVTQGMIDYYTDPAGYITGISR